MPSPRKNKANAPLRLKPYELTYDPALLEYVIEQVSTGRSLHDVCKDEEICVSETQVRLGIARSPELYRAFQAARQIGVEFRIEEAEAVLIGEGRWADVPFEVRKELSSHRKWDAGKLVKSRYGETKNIDMNHTVSADRPMKIIDASALDYEQLLEAQTLLENLIDAEDAAGAEIDAQST